MTAPRLASLRAALGFLQVEPREPELGGATYQLHISCCGLWEAELRRRRVCRQHTRRQALGSASLLFRGGDLDVVRHADDAVRVFRQPLGLGLGLLVWDRSLQVNDAVRRVDVDRDQILDPVRR